MDVYEIANEIILNSEFITDKILQTFVDSNKTPFYAIVSLSNSILLFKGLENLLKYEYIKNQFYSINSDVKNTISLKDFVKNLDNIILNSKKTGTKICKNIIQDMIDEILKMPIKDFLIIKGIYGIKLNDNLKSLKLGPFEIWHQPNYKNELKLKYPSSDELLWIGWQHEYLVTINIKARSKDKAYELANEKHYQFELFIYFAIGHYDKKFCVNIISKITYKYDAFLILDDSTFGSSHSREIIDIIPLDESYFTDSSIGNDKIWDLLTLGSKDQIKKRIITSIEWIGKANSEIDIKNRFLFYVIAIESMLTIQEKTMITPSIANSISESVALLLGKNYEERLYYEKELKAIYSIRSAIAHGNEKLVSEKEISLVSNVSRNILICFLTDPNIISINSMDKLIEYMKKIKYT
jgi:hypothetical protein